MPKICPLFCLDKIFLLCTWKYIWDIPDIYWQFYCELLGEMWSKSKCETYMNNGNSSLLDPIKHLRSNLTTFPIFELYSSFWISQESVHTIQHFINIFKYLQLCLCLCRQGKRGTVLYFFSSLKTNSIKLRNEFLARFI